MSEMLRDHMRQRLRNRRNALKKEDPRVQVFECLKQLL